MVLGTEQRILITLIRTEWIGLFSHPRSGHILPAVIAGILLVAWLYPVAPPSIAIIAALGLGLELQFTNCLSRSEREFEAFVILPVRWHTILLGKNIAALVISFFFLAVIMVTVYQFSPGRISTSDWSDPVVMFATMAFPLLHVGNNRAIAFPRRTSGWCPEDLVEGLWMVPTLGVLSLPYYLIINLFEMPWLSIPYVVVAGWLWYAISLPRAAYRITIERFPRTAQ